MDGPPYQPSIYVGSGELDSGPLVSIAHTAEPSSQPFFKANLTVQASASRQHTPSEALEDL